MEVISPMTPNTTVQNRSPSTSMSPSIKRKAVTGDEYALLTAEGKENGGIEKRSKMEASSSSAPLVELKGRKLVCKQEAIVRNLPRRRLLNFEGYLLDEAEAQRQVTEIPEEHWDLIVMAGHEQSSSNESLLAKHIRTALNISKGDEDILPTKAIEILIPKLFTLKQYGLNPKDFAPSASSITKVPASLQIKYWEANDVEKYYPIDQCQTLELRRAERMGIRQECLRILNSLDDVEKLELVKGDKLEKAMKPSKASKAEEVKDTESVNDSPQVTQRRRSREGTANTADSRRSASPSKKSKLTPEEEETARAKKEEREAKKAAIAEKKAAKEREEKRREAAKAKQAQTMNAFFKAKTATAAISRASPAGPSTLKKESVHAEFSDYARSFRPMAQRPHVHVAEYNRWADRRRKSGSVDRDVFGGANGRASNNDEQVKSWQPQDFLADHLRKHGKREKTPRARLLQGMKSMPLHGTVADVWNAVQDAEDPREVLNQLRDRTKFPWKTLAFDQQTRPPYCGTFTKKSVVVGPRTPFAQDPMFDYSYDSGDDWQDDEGGEDVDDFGETGPAEGEDEETEDEEEGEFDDWLDDEEEDVEFVPVDGEDAVPLRAELDQTRLPSSMKAIKKAREVPKKVVKLNPYWKGPIWESTIGEVGSEGLEGYRIQLLNETPAFIDPFTYISTDTHHQYKAAFSTTAIGSSLNVRCLLSTEAVMSKSDLAPLINQQQQSTKSIIPIVTNDSAPTTNTDGQAPTRSRVSGPKIAFPDSHLGELLQAIEGSTKIRTDLVSILREKFETITSKAAIEAKIKDVAVREGKTKDSPWRVKKEAWIAAGLTPPIISTPVSAPEPPPASTQIQPPNASEPIIVD